MVAAIPFILYMIVIPDREKVIPIPAFAAHLQAVPFSAPCLKSSYFWNETRETLKF
ncbi:hypothetical protein Cflav_PD0731 [Pedosphaera parvula Ellin514]|uniref:Uncharacterized protein n=1 Tax=Pedosphaera parvula (strain Ellin514) TaxID=320771 RepID=B9XR83_PEDPL|nr:hypothetical protein Cflav_PD0731 [Pedosphaera parvula Ellin514]